MATVWILVAIVVLVWGAGLFDAAAVYRSTYRSEATIWAVRAAPALSVTDPDDPNIALEDLYLRGPSPQSHALVDVKANGFRADHLDVSPQNTNIRGFIVGFSSAGGPQLTGTKILWSKIHDIGDGLDNYDHSIYCQGANGGGPNLGVWILERAGDDLHRGGCG